MKQLNKMLSFMLALVLMLQSMTVAFASTETMTAEEKAEVLYELGLFSGISTTEFVPNLEGDANREQAMKMIAVALDWEIDTSATSGFIDVSDWAQPYVAVAVEKGITNGVGQDAKGNELFGAQDDVTARVLATWFDRVITGSNNAWNDNAGEDNEEGVTRGYLVEATYDALKETPAGSFESLIETIVGEDMELLKIAIEGGLIEPDDMNQIGNSPNSMEPGSSNQIGSSPSQIGSGQNNMPSFIDDDSDDDDDDDEPTIEDIEVEDLDQIVITFSEYVDEYSAEDEDNYELYDEDDDEVDDIFDDIELTDDDEVTITFSEDLDEGDYTIVIDGVEDLYENEMDDEEDFEVEDDEDDEAPTIESIEVEDDDEIVITFSEDLDEDSAEDEDYYELYDEDDDEVDDIFDDIELTDDDEVTITFTDDLDGDYVLIVDGVEDLEGNDMDDYDEFSVGDEVSIDSVVLISSDEIEITFTDELEDFDIDDIIVYADEDDSEDYDDDDDEALDIDDYDLDEDDDVSVLTITLEDEVATDGYTYDSDGDRTDYLIRVTTVSSGITSENEDGDELEEDDDHEIEDEATPELVGYYAVDDDDDDEIDMIVAEYTEVIDEDELSTSTYDVDGYEIEDVYVDSDDEYLVIIEIEESGDDDLDEEPEVTQEDSVYDLSSNELEELDEEEAMSADDDDNPYM